jgi:hypothetical protein
MSEFEGKPGTQVPYHMDKEYWVRYLKEVFVDEVVTPEVVSQIRGSENMFEARQVAMDFQNALFDEEPGVNPTSAG